MNGMKSKAERLRLARKYKDGILIDPKEWTAADWRDLHLNIERIKARIRKRHERTK